MFTIKPWKRGVFARTARLILAQGAALLITVQACGGSVQSDDEPSTSSSTSGGVQGVACDVAVDGDPCSVAGESCGAIECYGCFKSCEQDGRWNVSCTEAPTCADVTVEQGGACDWFCVQLTCGPFDIPTACGQASVSAQCSTFGWFYNLPCDPDCESLSESECRTSTGCVWAVPCTDNPNTAPLSPRCIDFPPPVSTCEGVQCAGETSCVEVALSHDPSSGDCSGGGALVPLCVAP